MKLVAYANKIAESLFKSRRISREIESEVVKLEGEIQKQMARLEELKADLQKQNEHSAELENRHTDAVNAAKTEFGKDERFFTAPSEEINRAFSEEVLPDLHEI